MTNKGACASEQRDETPAAGSKTKRKSDVVNTIEPIDDDNLPF